MAARFWWWAGRNWPGPTASGARRSGAVFPASPTARVLEEGFRPNVTELGQRHPVTSGLEDLAPSPKAGGAGFGKSRWSPDDGQVLMEGIDGRPLLMLDRVEQRGGWR